MKSTISAQAGGTVEQVMLFTLSPTFGLALCSTHGTLFFYFIFLRMSNTEKPTAKAPNNSKRHRKPALLQEAKTKTNLLSPAFKAGELNATSKRFYSLLNELNSFSKEYGKNHYKIMYNLLCCITCSNLMDVKAIQEMICYLNDVAEVMDRTLLIEDEVEQLTWDSTIYYQIN